MRNGDDLTMTLEETLIAVREYHNKCRDKNIENHTSNGIEIDPNTLTWAEYWLTRMSDKEKTEVAVSGNCVLCGKQLDCGRLFVCKECELNRRDKEWKL